MCQNNFRLRYIPSEFLTVDESTLAFKVKYIIFLKITLIFNFFCTIYIIFIILYSFSKPGRVKFLQFNPSKPNKFHMKLFMVSEHKTGYMAGFSVYTGQVANELVAESAVSYEECTMTSKTVMGLLQRTRLLDNYRSVYFDNWFNSPQLLDEMYNRKTLRAGTVRQNRRGLPKAVVQRKLKKGETVYRRKGHLLCLKWCDKCPVTMLSSIHHSVEAQVKTNYLGNPVIKPIMIHDYNNRMNSIDHSDHMLLTYETLKSVKWYRKLMLHLVNMVVLNAFILNKKYGTRKMSHSSY